MEAGPEKGLICIAGRLVTGKCLNELLEVCENQKTISTSKLQIIVDRLQEDLIKEAICIRKMAIKNHNGV